MKTWCWNAVQWKRQNEKTPNFDWYSHISLSWRGMVQKEAGCTEFLVDIKTKKRCGEMMGELACEKTEKPYCGSVNDSIQKSYCRKKKIRETMQKASSSITQHGCCIVWFWLTSALWKIAFCEGHAFSIYTVTELNLETHLVCNMDTDNLSVQCVDSGCCLGIRGVIL